MNIKITDKSVIITDGKKKEVKSKSEIVTPASRNILFFKNIVIKFDNPDRIAGYQCEVEAEKYQEIEDEDKKYFATVLDSGEGWIAMERVKFIHPNRCDWDLKCTAQAKLYYLEQKYDIWDLHYENWGIKENGDPVIFDYGITS